MSTLKNFAITNVCHSLIVSNNQVYSYDEFDLWPVYSGERFRASWPFCFRKAKIIYNFGLSEFNRVELK